MVFRFSGSQIWYQFWGMKEEIGIQSPNILRKLSKGVSPGLFRWVFIVDWLLFFLFVCFFTETPGTVSGLLTLHPDLSSLFWERQRRDFPLQDGHQEAAAFLPRPTILLPINKPTLALSKILLFTVLLSEEKKERSEKEKKEEKSCLSQFLDHQVHLRLRVRSADLEGHATQETRTKLDFYWESGRELNAIRHRLWPERKRAQLWLLLHSCKEEGREETVH